MPGSRSTWAALEAGKTVALANKETLVMAGPLVMRAGRQARRQDPARRQRAQRGVSGAAGRAAARRSPRHPDRQRRAVSPPVRSEQLAQVTVADALAHPTWNMGPKITIDSATMMNKALEIIEGPLAVRPRSRSRSTW